MSDTIILSQDNTQVTFDIYNVESVEAAVLSILDKEIDGVLDIESGFLTIQVTDILNQIQLPMCYCHIKVELIDTTIEHYEPTMLSLVPTL